MSNKKTKLHIVIHRRCIFVLCIYVLLIYLSQLHGYLLSALIVENNLSSVGQWLIKNDMEIVPIN